MQFTKQRQYRVDNTKPLRGPGPLGVKPIRSWKPLVTIQWQSKARQANSNDGNNNNNAQYYVEIVTVVLGLTGQSISGL